MKYNYKKSGETKYLNIGSEAEVTALNGRLFQRGITVYMQEEVLQIGSACKGNFVTDRVMSM